MVSARSIPTLAFSVGYRHVLAGAHGVSPQPPPQNPHGIQPDGGQPKGVASAGRGPGPGSVRSHGRDASRIASSCARSDWDAIVAAGGDGTLNEVINGRRADGPPVGLIPLGTANLAALEMGVGPSPRAIAGMLVHGPERPAYVGSVNDRRFLLMTGVGFDAKIVQSVSTRVKRLLGKGAYVLELLAQLGRYDFPRFDMEIDGVKTQAASLVVANGHYYAGPYVCAAAASIDRPGLFACIFENAGPFSAVRYGVNLVLGRLEAGRGYRVVPASRIVIDGPRDEPVQIDGDPCGRVPIVIEAQHDAIPLIRVPAKYAVK